jgi:hypothetical protein
MFRLLGWLVMLSVGFAAGYWAGQRPIGELQKSVTDLSKKAMDQTQELTRKAVDTTSGVERSLRVRQGLVDAKDRLVQAKSDLLEKNYGSAAKNMDEVVTDLERIGGVDNPRQRNAVQAVLVKARDARAKLNAGRPVGQATLNQIQKGLDEIREPA